MQPSQSHNIEMLRTLLIVYLVSSSSTMAQDVLNGDRVVKGDSRSLEERQCACENKCWGGTPGVPGMNGMHGKDGTPGMPGHPGPMGVQGPPGAQGSRGKKGYAGLPGPTGAPGLSKPGTKGEKGEPGGPVRISRHSGRDNVVFSVSRRNTLGPVTDDTVVVFDKIYTNIGNSFDTATSEFVVKGNGTYIFHLHVMSQKNSEGHAWLMVNDRHHSPVSGDGTNRYGTGSTTVILNLSRNDKVWVQLTKGSTLMNDYTTFSGYLIG